MNRLIDKGQVGRNIALSITAQAVSIAVSMIFNLIVPKFIEMGQFAYWQSYNLYVSYVGVLHFGLLDGLLLRYAAFDYEDLDKMRMRSQFRMLLLLTLPFSVAGIAIALMFLPRQAAFVTLAVSVGIMTKNLVTYNLYCLQITNRINGYASVILTQRLTFCILALVLLSCGCNNFILYCAADLIGDCMGILFAGKFNFKLIVGESLGRGDSVKEAKHNLSAGVILMISNWIAMLFVGVTRMVVQWMWDMDSFGKVSYAFSLVNLFMLFIGAISVAVFPSLKRIDEHRFPEVYSNVRPKLSALMLSLLILYFPCKRLLGMWVPMYMDSLEYLGLLFPMIVFSSTVGLLDNNFLNACRKEKKMLFVNLISLVVLFVGDILIAVLFHNLRLLILWTLASMSLRSFLAEREVRILLDVHNRRIFAIEVFVSVAFVILVTSLPL